MSQLLGSNGNEGDKESTTTIAPPPPAEDRFKNPADESFDNEEFSTDLHSYDYLRRNEDEKTTIVTVDVMASDVCFKDAPEEASNRTFCGKAGECLVRCPYGEIMNAVRIEFIRMCLICRNISVPD